jgi:DNA-binding transcriptional LysR family regulator
MELGTRRFTGKVGDNDLRLLRTFCTVVRHGGFAAAESELQIGLPSISRYIKDLEIRLGLRLCERGRRGFALTAEGKELHDACATLFDNLETFETQVRDILADPAGILRMGMVDSLASDPQFQLSQAVRAYKLTYPSIHFAMSTNTSNSIEQDVIDGTLDIGIVFNRRNVEQLSYHLLHEEISYLYCSVDHPLWSKHGGSVNGVDLGTFEFAGYPMVHVMEGMGIGGIFRRTATTNNMEIIAMLVSSGAYLGFLPQHYVSSLKEEGRFRAIAPEQFHFESRISAITRSGPVSPLVSSFLAQLKTKATGKPLEQVPAAAA